MEVICANSLCARTFSFAGGPAHFRRTPQHYCSRSCQNTTHGLAGTKEYAIWEQTKKRARENGVRFTLTVHDIPQVPECCPVLGIPLKANDKAGPLDSSPSLDRIKPGYGYVPGNVRVISHRANRLRSDGTAAELALVAADAALIESEVEYA